MFNLMRKLIKEIRATGEPIIFYNMTNAVVESLYPFVNIFFTAKIVASLMVGAPLWELLLLAGMCVGFNFFFLNLKLNFELLGWTSGYPGLVMKEQFDINDKLFTVDFERLESPTFEDTARKYREGIMRKGSHLSYFRWIIYKLTAGVTQFVVAIILLMPLLSISFKRTGDGFVHSPYLMVSVIVGVVLLSVLVFFIDRGAHRHNAKHDEKFLELNKIFNYYMDIISDYKTGKEIRVFDEAELIEKEATRELLDKGAKIRKKIATRSGMSSGTMAVIGAIAGFGIYTLVGLKGQAGAFAVSDLVLYMGSLMMCVNSIMAIMQAFSCVPFVMKTVGYYFAIKETQNAPQGTVKPTKLVADAMGGVTIVFRNVSFKYPESKNYALKNLNLKLNPKDKLAVVGQNGSGKTTFIKLLTKMYAGYEGDIFVNGVNIRECDTEDYRKLFAVVFQDYKIFAFTVADNIAPEAEREDGKLTAEEEARLTSAIAEAGIAERVAKLSNGVNSYIYKEYVKDGVDLSEGEAQKLALARALYKDAPFIVLDEPTASLDPIAEQELYEKFNEFVEGKSSIFISHRLSSCRFCDKIAVFNKGELVQFGSHNNLIKDEQGKYYALWNAQAQYYTND